MQLTELQIETIIAETCGTYRTGGSYTFEDVWNCIEKALAAHSAGAPGEPVAIVRDNPDDIGTFIEATCTLPVGTPLYAHPQPMTDAARDALDDIIAARKAMLKRVDDVHIADRQTGCSTVYDHELERSKALLFRAIDVEIERLDRSKGE